MIVSVFTEHIDVLLEKSTAVNVVLQKILIVPEHFSVPFVSFTVEVTNTYQMWYGQY